MHRKTNFHNLTLAESVVTVQWKQKKEINPFNRSKRFIQTS